MLRKKSSEGVSCRNARRECLWQFSVSWNKIRASIKRKKWRGASLRSKTRSLEDQRGALSQIEEPDSFLEEPFLSQKPFPFSKAGRDSEITKQSAFPVCRHSLHATVSFAEITGSFVRKRVISTINPSTGCRQKWGNSSGCEENFYKFRPLLSTAKAHPLNLSSSPRMYSQRNLSSSSVFFIPWNTPETKSSKAKVFHIKKVKSKSISYHAFSSPSSEERGESEILIAYLVLLSSTHLRPLPARFKNKPVQRYFFKSKSISQTK